MDQFARFLLQIDRTFNNLKYNFFEIVDYLIMKPLVVDEIIHYLIYRWGKKYDFRLFKRGNYLYFQMMWGFLGQESFPLDEVEYKKSIADKIEILNRCGYSEEVREWLKKVNSRPRLGRAVSLQLNINERMKEFLI